MATKPSAGSGVIQAVGVESVMPVAGLCAPARAVTRALPATVHELPGAANDAAMARYAAGDDAAFATLYDGLSPLVLAYLRRRTTDRAVIEDLVQETFLRIHLHRGRYQADAPVLPWALTIAARLLANRLRGARRAGAVFREDDRVDERATDAASPEQIAIGMQLAAQLEDEVLRLSTRDQEAFDLVKRGGVPLRDAAPRLGMSLTALKMRLFRVCGRLRQAWDPESGDRERKRR